MMHLKYLTKKKRVIEGKRKAEASEPFGEDKKKKQKVIPDKVEKKLSARIVPKALRIAPCSDDDEGSFGNLLKVPTKERSIRITKSGAPLPPFSQPVASRTRSGKGFSVSNKPAEPTKLKRLRKQFSEPIVEVTKP